MLTNADRLARILRAEALDAVLATTPENVTYCSGFWSLSQWIRRGPQAYVLVPAEGLAAACLIAPTSTLDLAADQALWVGEIRRYGGFQIDAPDPDALSSTERRLLAILGSEDGGDAVATTVAAIRARGLERARIGVDEVGILPAYFERLKAALPEAELVPAFETFRRIRAVKTDEEIARLRRAANIAERSIEAALATMHAGVSEREMAVAFHARTVAEHAEPVLGCIGFGARSAMANVQPSDARLREGDIVRFDVGGRYRHYRADIARIATLGTAPNRVRSYYGALRDGVLRGMEMMRPGVRAAEIFAAVVETVRGAGLPHYKRSHVGHGIGIDGYDLPHLTPSSADVLEEGMVLCIETPYYELGFGGLQLENTLRITADGVESFMTLDNELIER
jgi:Xaa-Pro aminopeptidase